MFIGNFRCVANKPEKQSRKKETIFAVVVVEKKCVLCLRYFVS